MKAHTLLIADDDREHLLMLAFILKKAGYRVVSAFDAKNAIQLAVEQDPDLLLLDIHMGNEDGFSIQKRLQKIEELAGKPVIYLTGDHSTHMQQMTASLGAAAIVRKPFDTHELLAAIETALTHGVAAAASRQAVRSYSPKPMYASAETYIG